MAAGSVPWTEPTARGIVPQLSVDLNAAPHPRHPGDTLLGGKGANLYRLAHHGFPVPRGYCLTTEAYREVLDGVLATSPRVPDSPEALHAGLLRAALPGAVGRALAELYATLKRDPGLPRLAVRSSATGEDSAEASHAGQAATFLNVAGFEELLQAVRGCWSSLWDPGHLVYRHRPCRPPNGPFIARAPAMAVVVQAMVAADVAGVLFTADPLGGGADEMMISAAWGLGETVVAGGAADTYVVDRRGHLLRRALANKNSLIEQSPDGGTRSRRLRDAEAGHACMSDALLRRLAQLGQEVEHCLGGPQDIEWAAVDGRVYLLQARPITTGSAARAAPAPRRRWPGASLLRSARGLRLPRLGTDPAAVHRLPQVWSNANVGEALPGAATPMTWSIIRAFSRRGFEQAFRALGLDVPPHYGLVGNIRGRIYLNLSQFMSLASGVPLLSPGILARVAGGIDEQTLRGAYVNVSPLTFLRRLPVSGLRVLRSQLVAPRQARSLQRRFALERQRFGERSLPSLSWSELRQTFHHTQSLFSETGDILLTVSSNALASFLLMDLLLAAGGAEAHTLKPALFTGLQDLSSAAPGLALLELARRARSDGLQELLADEVDGGELLGRLRASPEAQPFLSAFTAFLQEHGHRAVREPELSTPRWREDPSFPLEVIATYLAAGELPSPTAMRRRQLRARRVATQRARALLPVALRPMLGLLLPLAQDATRLRELLRSLTTETIGMYRAIFLEVGQRLTSQGLLGDPQDVFFLTIDEVAGMLRDGPRRLIDRVLERRARHDADLAAPDPPPLFRLQAAALGAPLQAPESSAAPGALVLRGQPGSAGRVEGTVRVISSPRAGHALRPGEILVARTADVGWTPLFLVASGVVLDQSGPLSHPVVVAREYGLPAVVGTGRAAELLHTGDRVLLDGAAGTVRLLATAAPQAEATPAQAAPETD